jgi:O-antigen ligase
VGSAAADRRLVAARVLFLVGVFAMVAGDWPAFGAPPANRVIRWAAMVGPWLYLLFLALSFALLAWTRRWRAPAGIAALIRPVGTLALAFLVSAVFSQAPALSWVAVACFVVVLAFGLTAAWFLDDDRAPGLLSLALTAAVVVLATRVVGWRLSEGLSAPAFHVPNNAWLGKLQIAWVLNLVAPFLFAGFLGERRLALAAFYGSAWLASGAAVHVLYSRAGSLVFAVTTLLVCALNAGRWRRWLTVLGALVLLVGVIVLSGGLAMSRSVAASLARPDRDAGIRMRTEVWRETVRMIRDRPLTGVGLGTYDDVAYSRYGTSGDRHFFRNGWHAHNLLLHLAAETGALGVVAWGYFWVVVVGLLWRQWRSGEPTQKLAASAGLGLAAAFFVLSMTEVLVAMRVHASLRMNLTLTLLVVYGVRSAGAGPAPEPR